MRDIFLSATGSFRVRIAWIVGGMVEFMRDLVCLAIGYWSPFELTSTWVIFGIVSGFCCIKPLENMALFFSWPPLEVGVGYLTGTTACLGKSGNTVGF